MDLIDVVGALFVFLCVLGWVGELSRRRKGGE